MQYSNFLTIVFFLTGLGLAGCAGYALIHELYPIYEAVFRLLLNVGLILLSVGILKVITLYIYDYPEADEQAIQSSLTRSLSYDQINRDGFRYALLNYLSLKIALTVASVGIIFAMISYGVTL